MKHSLAKPELTADFWCRECETKFTATSEHKEFAQAKCNICHFACESFEFELEEAERSYKAEQMAGRGVSAIFFALFGWLGILASPTSQSEPELPTIFQYMDGSFQRPSVFSGGSREDAMPVFRFLGDNGVIAKIEKADDRFLVTVDLRDRNRAKRFLQQLYESTSDRLSN